MPNEFPSLIENSMNRFATLCSFLTLALISGLSLTPAANAQRPKLVVVVTVDQLPYSYLSRFGDKVDPKGIFRRVKKEGVSYIECNYATAFTFTGPGHATIATGAHPNVHGIIDNSWYFRGADAIKNCVSDDNVDLIGSISDWGASPQHLLVPTLGDSLKLATAKKGKVYSIGYKDRAAIFTAGRMADGAFWFDSAKGNWVTSTAYRGDLPGYLRQMNEMRGADAFAEQEWKPLHLDAAYELHRPDENELETPIRGMDSKFPHKLPAADNEDYYYQLATSPFFNQYVLASAAAIIENELLGKDGVPDLLFVNLSSNDYVGHNFGPYSKEVEDMFYRTDLQLGVFAAMLDETVGAGEWTLALTSDHGVAPIPAFAEQQGLLAKHHPLKDLDQVKAILESQLTARFGSIADDQPAYVSAVLSNQVYLQQRHPNLDGERFEEAQRLVETIMLAHPSVVAAATRESLLAHGGAGEPMRRKLFRAFHPDRSGDVLFVLAPYQYDPRDYCASHGSPWRYDTHVPLMILGQVTKGVFDRPVDPSMLAPTLARLLHIPQPAASHSQPLHEVLP